MSYFTEHPELLDGLPEHWKSFSDRDWFPYVVGALARPDERMRKQLIVELGQPDMPERVWQFAISSFMLVLTYKWPPVEMSGTEDAWRLFRQHLIQTYEDDLASHDLVTDVSQDSGQGKSLTIILTKMRSNTSLYGSSFSWIALRLDIRTKILIKIFNPLNF